MPVLPQYTSDSSLTPGRNAASNQAKTCPHCLQSVSLDYHPPSTSSENDFVSSICPACWDIRHELNRQGRGTTLDDATFDEPIALVAEWSVPINLRPLHPELLASHTQSEQEILPDADSPTNIAITAQPITILRPFRASKDGVEDITYRPSPINTNTPNALGFSSSPSSRSSTSSSSPPLSPSLHEIPSPVDEPSWLSRRPGSATETLTAPSPYTDITRLRVKSVGMGPLYAGSVFSGTQNSGPSSYDVTVTIVDADFSSSKLCGYLQIRDLTPTNPVLTTFFDAEIIGSQYGFVTSDDWGSSEAEDMKHWQRFQSFRPLKGELKRPHLTMREKDRGVVFMRWKERFLVPDHKIKDIHGASFAGFYYVCVEFNPPPPPQRLAPGGRRRSSLTLPIPKPLGLDNALFPVAFPTIGASAERSVSPTRIHTPIASMTGYYFHHNSQPYQQLTLRHVPEDTTSSFEFR